MPPRWALRLGPELAFFLNISLLLTTIGHFGTATVLGTKRLYCMSCVRVESGEQIEKWNNNGLFPLKTRPRWTSSECVRVFRCPFATWSRWSASRTRTRV